MAQTNFTPISLYYSSTASNVPTAGNLVAGELAINTADGKLFYKDSAGVVQVIGTKGGVGSSTTTQVLYNSSGLVVGSANMTFNGTTLTLANDASISGLTVGKGGSATTFNTAFGVSSLAANTSGGENTAVGYQSLKLNTTGGANAAFGVNALQANTTGNFNIAIGENALNANTTASYNTAVGYQAGYTNTTGTSNVFVGYQAGNVSTGGENCFVGSAAGLNTTTGTGNTYVGRGASTAAGYLMTTGSKNTILGGYSGNQGGLDIRTSSNYIVLSDGDGNPAGYWNGGSTWTFRNPSGRFSQINLQIGSTIGVQTYTDNVANAYFVIAGGSNGVFLANGGTSWTSNSDSRLKNVTGTFTNALDDVAQLEAVKFTWKSDESNKPCVGLIAQSVEKVLPEAITKTASIKDDDTEYLGVQYTEVVPLLVAAIQELKAEFDAYKATHP